MVCLLLNFPGLFITHSSDFQLSQFCRSLSLSLFFFLLFSLPPSQPSSFLSSPVLFSLSTGVGGFKNRYLGFGRFTGSIFHLSFSFFLFFSLFFFSPSRGYIMWFCLLTDVLYLLSCDYPWTRCYSLTISFLPSIGADFRGMRIQSVMCLSYLAR